MKRIFLLLFLVFTVLCPGQVRAQGMILIRDAEIERALRVYSTPIFQSAGLTPEAIRFYLIQDDVINAFVAGGSNIFIHTGLIMASDTPEMLIGVLAHETGHIAGGHLIKGTEALADARTKTLVSSLLAGVAGIAGGANVGAAVASAGMHVAEQGFLAHTRAHEEAADQAALGYLDANRIPAEGMLQMFELLRGLEHRRFGADNPYMRTHPAHHGPYCAYS